MLFNLLNMSSGNPAMLSSKVSVSEPSNQGAGIVKWLKSKPPTKPSVKVRNNRENCAIKENTTDFYETIILKAVKINN